MLYVIAFPFVTSASEWARTPGKSVTFSTPDSPEEPPSPIRASKSEQPYFKFLFSVVVPQYYFFSLICVSILLLNVYILLTSRVGDSKQNSSKGNANNSFLSAIMQARTLF